MTYKSTNKFYIDNKPLKDKLVALTSNQHYRPRKLGCRCYDNALIQPFKIYDGVFGGGVLTLDNEIVPNTGYHEYIHQPYPFSEKDVTCRDEIVLYIGCIYQCWGHLFTDCFSKLWFLNSQDYTKMRENGIKVVYITKDNKPLSPFVYDLFDIAGVNLRDFEHISKHTRFNAVYVPDNSFYLMINPYERMFTDEYLQLLASIRSKYISRKGNYPEKIYLSRTKLGQDKRDYGEISVERFMKQAGYTVVYPEHHSVDEQIDMMVHCKHLAATEGSISLNSLFCQPGTELLVIKKVHIPMVIKQRWQMLLI